MIFRWIVRLGVKKAVLAYCWVIVDQLTNAQAAVIASILRSPGLYDPAFKEGNAERLANRFEYVKNNMVEAGWLSKEDAAKMKLPTVAPRSTSGQLSGPKGHVIEAVQKELAKLGFSQDQLLVGGLVIKTPLLEPNTWLTKNGFDLIPCAAKVA